MKYNELNILLISPIPPPAGGIATWTIQYLEWAKKNNLRVEIVNTSLKGKRAKKINSNTNYLDEIKRSIDIFRDLRSKLKQEKISIVHLNTACGKFGILRDYLCGYLVKKHKKKLIVHYRCNIKDQVAHGSIQYYFLKKLNNISDSNFVLNKKSQEYLQLNFEKKSKIIPNFIDESFLNDQNIKIRKKIDKVLFIGHVQKTKGIFEIFEAAKKLPKIYFQLAGPISDESIQKELPDNVNLVGIVNRDEVKELLLNTDLFLFPTHTEGFSNALLEAMSLGLPIITTPVGANIDMLENKGGLIIEVGDNEGIVKAINELENVTRREMMAQWNLKKVKKNYTTEKVMKLLINEYTSV